MITSKTNSKVRYARSLHRRAVRHQERRFVVEGVRLIEEMIEAGQKPALFFCTEDSSGNPRARALVELLVSSGSEVVTVSEEVLRFLSDTETPQGVLAVAAFPEVEVAVRGLSLIVDGVRDPGNLGTILRTAQAAGVGRVVTLRGTVDVFSPKVVRGAMGAHFRLPISWDRIWEEVERMVGQSQVLLADPTGGVPYFQVDWTLPTALIVGSEAHGAGRKGRQLATTKVTVPMEGNVESLNVGVAASVMLFEAARQRREAGVELHDG
ncbi:MAG: RNA methyltransferase [Anaerolineae bacterium]